MPRNLSGGWRSERSRLEDMRIKILELVMGVEKRPFAGTVKYAISCRRNYIHEIQEYTDIEGMKKWFLGKTSEICSNMESAREKEAVSIIEKAKSYIRDNYKKIFHWMRYHGRWISALLFQQAF